MTDEQIVRTWSTKGYHPMYGDSPKRCYAVVQAAHVPDDVCDAAKASSTVSCALLGISEPRVVWFERENERERAYRSKYGVADWVAFEHPAIGGLADRDQHAIGIDANQHSCDVVEVTAHEVRHLAQRSDDWKANEDDAEAFASKVFNALVPCLYGRRVAPRRVLKHVGYPFSGETFAGVAEYNERLLAWDEGTVSLYRNDGSKDSPRWVRLEGLD